MNKPNKLIAILLIWFYICGLYNAVFNNDYSKISCIAAIIIPPYTIYIGIKENILYFVDLTTNTKICTIKNGQEICK